MKLMSKEMANWLMEKYLDWQRDAGELKTAAEFAAYIGVSQPTISMWLSGKREPHGKNVDKLAAKFGPEIYDILGLARPDPDLQPLLSAYDDMDPEARQSLLRILESEEQFSLVAGLMNNTPPELYMPIMSAVLKSTKEIIGRLSQGSVPTDEGLKIIARNILISIYESGPNQRAKIEEILRDGFDEN